MFIDAAVFKRLCKNSYKTTGLTVQRTKDWIVVNGSWWQLEVTPERFNKKEKSILIELVGDLPGIGETYRADALGNQYELKDVNIHWPEMPIPEMKKRVYRTKVLMESKEGRLYRVMKTNKESFKLNQAYLDIIDIGKRDEDETIPMGPVTETDYPRWIYWYNGTCRFMAYVVPPEDDTYEKEFLDEIGDIDAGEND